MVSSDQFNSTLSQQKLDSSSGNGQWTYGGHFGSTSLVQTNGNTWSYLTNTSQQNVHVAYSENSQGLHIGVQGISTDGNNDNSTYTGFYALSSSLHASLFHATITSAYKVLSSGNLQVGLYVQDASNKIDYLTCGAYTSTNGTHWHVVHATGITEATNFTYLWTDNAPNQASTRGCTIVTNGDNYLAVYLDGNRVYQNTTLSLNMKEPFLASLEIETTNHDQVLNGTWSDFYSTTGPNITITNAPHGSTTASIVSQDGKVLATTPIVNHTAMFNMAKYEFPILGSIRTFASNGTVTGSTGGIGSLNGGDIFSGNSPSPVSSTIGFVLTPTFLYFLAIPVTLIVVLGIVARRATRKNSTKRA